MDAETGDLAAYYRYDPFGRLITAEGVASEDNPFKFSTKYFDGEYQLYYYGYRYYSAEMGRWINKDPIEEAGGLNLYAFVYNDPTNWVDPSGESPFSYLAKKLIKHGIKKGLKEFGEKTIKKRLQKYMNKKMAREFAEDLADILSTLDSKWWEVCIEFIPVAGDLYGGGKLAIKVRKAYDKLQDLENKYVEKIYNSLSKNAKKKFIDKMRKKGVSDARIDTKAQDKITGTSTKIKGKDGHHMDSVGDNPGKASDPRNIDFQDRSDHFDSHGGNCEVVPIVKTKNEKI